MEKVPVIRIVAQVNDAATAQHRRGQSLHPDPEFVAVDRHVLHETPGATTFGVGRPAHARPRPLTSHRHVVHRPLGDHGARIGALRRPEQERRGDLRVLARDGGGHWRDARQDPLRRLGGRVVDQIDLVDHDERGEAQMLAQAILRVEVVGVRRERLRIDDVDQPVQVVSRHVAVARQATRVALRVTLEDDVIRRMTLLRQRGEDRRPVVVAHHAHGAVLQE